MSSSIQPSSRTADGVSKKRNGYEGKENGSPALSRSNAMKKLLALVCLLMTKRIDPCYRIGAS
jgi:hypothetical protein